MDPGADDDASFCDVPQRRDDQGLAIAGSLAALIVFDAVFRATQRAIMRPARETLFTVVRREDKYKAKAFIDTFVYRGGDALGAQTEGSCASAWG